MSTSKKIDKIAIVAMCIAVAITILFMFGESLGITAIERGDDDSTNKMFTNNDLNADWDEADATKIVLKGDSAVVTGSGAYFNEGTLYIACAGKYVLSGDLDGSVHIDANSNDKIWLMLDGVDISSNEESPMYIKQADKVFLTLKENSQNSMTFESDDEDSDTDGSIFSRDDLTINGEGSLEVNSSTLHGIVCNDTLAITGGDINITAKNDAVHAHDAIKICNAALTISAGDDALHAGNDDETAFFYIESGSVDIKECYEGIEANDVNVVDYVYFYENEYEINANDFSFAPYIYLANNNVSEKKLEELVDEEYLRVVIARMSNIPLKIAENRRFCIRELVIEDCESVVKLYENEKYIKIEPKIKMNEHEEVKTYIIISMDNYTANNTNPYYRDCTVNFDIICHTDY